MIDHASLDYIAKKLSCFRSLGRRNFFGTPRYAIPFSALAGPVVELPGTLAR
jgi:hypothetical protein